MKSLLLLAAFSAFSTSAFSAEALLKLTRHSGFAPIPFGSVVSVYETGRVELLTVKGMVQTKTRLPDVSPNTIQDIKDNIQDIRVKDALVDLESKKPKCMDAPSSKIFIRKNQKEVLIASYAFCHKAQMLSKAAAALIKTAQEIDSQRK